MYRRFIEINEMDRVMCLVFIFNVFGVLCSNTYTKQRFMTVMTSENALCKNWFNFEQDVIDAAIDL